jgi:hypothetical protein
MGDKGVTNFLAEPMVSMEGLELRVMGESLASHKLLSGKY